MTWHSVTNPIVEIDGDTAVVRSRIQALHADFGARGRENQLTEWGVYRHVLQRTQSGWRITALEYRCLFARGNRNIFSH